MTVLPTMLLTQHNPSAWLKSTRRPTNRPAGRRVERLANVVQCSELWEARNRFKLSTQGRLATQPWQEEQIGLWDCETTRRDKFIGLCERNHKKLRNDGCVEVQHERIRENLCVANGMMMLLHLPHCSFRDDPAKHCGWRPVYEWPILICAHMRQHVVATICGMAQKLLHQHAERIWSSASPVTL